MNKLIVKNENDKLLTLESSLTGSLALLKSDGVVLLSVSLDSKGTFHIDLNWTLVKDNKSKITLPEHPKPITSPHTMDTSSDLSTKTSSLAGYPTGIKHSEK